MVEYRRCGGCGSLQTEPPYWLDEAYLGNGEKENNLSSVDTGAAHRNVTNLAASLIVARTLKLTNVLDFGGGDGLLCRLLRDHGLNAFVKDAHADATYARGFSEPDFTTPDLLTAFEVLEHLGSPAEDLQQIFEGKPSAIFVSTLPYGGQGPDWWYLTPTTGQHVFFYGEEAFKHIASEYGYDLVRAGGYTLFVKSGRSSDLKRKFLKHALRYKPIRFYRGILGFTEPKGMDRDFERLTATK
jgi:hypothetical protein